MEGSESKPENTRPGSPLHRSDEADGLAADLEVARASSPSHLRSFLRNQGDSAAADRLFRRLTLLAALTIFVILALVVFELIIGSWPSISNSGFGFFRSSKWNPATGDFGALAFLSGTLASSGIAMVLAVPFALAVAIFLTEMCPRALRTPLTTLTDFLSAVPSVVYGLWALFVLVPLVRSEVGPGLAAILGWTGLFDGANYGIGVLAAGIVLAIMVLPPVLSLSREIMSAVPHSQREAVLALGATRWEMVRVAVLRNARLGILGAVVLGFGRAVGETIAVVMVIGNRPAVVNSLFAQGASMASVIANEFGGAQGALYRSALIEIGLALFTITILVNTVARILVWAAARETPAGARSSYYWW